MRGLPLVLDSRGSSLVVVLGLLAVAFLLVAQALGAWPSVAAAPSLSRCVHGLSCSVACGPGIETHVACIGRWVLIHGATREV